MEGNDRPAERVIVTEEGIGSRCRERCAGLDRRSRRLMLRDAVDRGVTSGTSASSNKMSGPIHADPGKQQCIRKIVTRILNLCRDVYRETKE
jgi:hypothetical protein